MQLFPSKVDLWLVVVLAVAPIAVAAGMAAVALDGDWRGAAVAALPLAFILGLYGGLLYPVRYEVHESTLVVRYGLVRNRVPIANIVQR